MPVLLRLQSALGIDLQLFSEDEEARLTARAARRRSPTRRTAAPCRWPSCARWRSSCRRVAQVLLRLHQRGRDAEDRLSTLAAGSDGDRFAGDARARHAQPHEEVREFFYARHNHMAVLDERAEALYDVVHGRTRTPRRRRAARRTTARARRAARGYLLRRARRAHRASRTADAGLLRTLRRRAARTSALTTTSSPAQRAFQLGDAAGAPRGRRR